MKRASEHLKRVGFSCIILLNVFSVCAQPQKLTLPPFLPPALSVPAQPESPFAPRERELTQLLIAVSEQERLNRFAEKAKLIKNARQYEKVLSLAPKVVIVTDEDFTPTVEVNSNITVRFPAKFLKTLEDITSTPPSDRIQEIRNYVGMALAANKFEFWSPEFQGRMSQFEPIFFAEVGKLECENALLFMLAHEYGHALLDDEGDQMPKEINADAYAWLLSCSEYAVHTRIHAFPRVSTEMINTFGGTIALNLTIAVFRFARYGEEVLQYSGLQFAMKGGEVYAFNAQRVSNYLNRLASYAPDRFKHLQRYEKYRD